MTLTEFKMIVSISDDVGIETFVMDNTEVLKATFSNLTVSHANNADCRAILVRLARVPAAEKQAFQFIYTLVAFYFKMANIKEQVVTCFGRLNDSILKYRLQAWHKYKNYRELNSHVKLFPKYLEVLSKAVSDDVEEYVDDVLLDLREYYLEYSHRISDFKNQFEDAELLRDFPLLKEFKKRQYYLDHRLELQQATDKIYTPSIFTEQLFDEKFIHYIKFHPHTKWHATLLGYDNYTIRSEVIKYGQANFDNIYNDLSSEQIVKLYCYFNMRKHYFSSLYLFERCTIHKLFAQNGCTKFIDIGCGPATSGVALTDYLFSFSGEFMPFDYIGIDIYESMLNTACNLMSNHIYTTCSEQQYYRDIRMIDPETLSQSKVIVINACYLFASPSLEIDKLAKEVNMILTTNLTKPRFFLFQNTTDPGKNVRYEQFKKLLISHFVMLSEKTIVKYNNQRNSTYIPKQEPVFFEVLKFQ